MAYDAARSKRWRERHPEKHLENFRKWRAANPEYSRERVRIWAKENPDKVAAKNQEFRERNPEYGKNWYAANRERHSARGKIWYRENRSQRYATARKWTENNRERVRFLAAKWAKENPEKCRAQEHARRARKIGNGGRYTQPEWIALKEFFGNICLGCGLGEIQIKSLRRKLVPDHVIPIAKGGSSYIWNIQPLCHGRGGCNNKKSAKHIDYRIAA